MGHHIYTYKIYVLLSFLIQTLLSVSELHRFMPYGSRTITAGKEFHLSPKTYHIHLYVYSTTFMILSQDYTFVYNIHLNYIALLEIELIL